MEYKRLKQFADKNGWKTYNNIAYKEIEGFLFTLADIQNYKVFIIPFFELDDKKKDEILDFLNHNMDMLGIFEVEFDSNDMLIVKFQEIILDTRVIVLEKYVFTVLEFFKKENIVSSNICFLCKKEDADENVFCDVLYLKAHRNCLENHIKEIDKAAAELTFENKDYFSSFAFAFLGGLIPSIFWMGLNYYFALISSFIAIFVPICAFKSYDYFNGKNGVATKWLVMLSVALCFIVVQIVLVGETLIKEGSLISIENYFKVFENKKMYFKYHRSMWLGLLFIVAGIINIYVELKGNIKDKLPKIIREN